MTFDYSNKSKLLMVIGTLNSIILSWIFVIVLIPMFIFIFADSEVLAAEFERLPGMILIFGTGAPFLLYALLSNLGYLFRNKYYKHLKISFTILIIYIWVLVLYGTIVLAGLGIMSINILFIPLYIEVALIWYRQKSRKETLTSYMEYD